MKKMLLSSLFLSCTLLLFSQNNCHLKIGTNLAGATDYGSEWPFVNIFKNSRAWITHNHPDWTEGVPWDPWDTGMESQIPMDENGYPLQVPFEAAGADTAQVLRTVWANTGQIPSGTYVLLYDGQGVISFWGDAQIQSQIPGRIEVQVNGGPDANSGIIGMEIEESQWGDHIRNIRFLLPGTEGTYESNPWTQEWIEKLEPFNALRFMDWGATNNSNLRHWDERPKVDDARYTLNGVPYEWMIEICNQKQADAWVCIPHLADEDYVEQMATLFRDQLDPGLNLYVEYSNEVWNWLFTQAHYGNDSLNQNLPWPERLAPKIGEVMQIWTNVFDGQTNRLTRVIGCQHGWYDIGSRIFQQLQTDGQDHLIDAISPASYMSVDHGQLANLGAAATPQEVISGAADVTFDPLGWHIENWKLNAALAAENNKKLVYYEGGQHFTPDPWGTVQPYNPAMMGAQEAPEMYDLYQQLLDSLATFTEEETVMMHFSFISPLWEDPNEGAYGNFGALTSQFFQGEPYSDAPKYQALRDHIESCTSPTATEEIATSISIDVYPNPSSNRFQIQGEISISQWELRNSKGQLLQQGFGQELRKGISLAGNPAGVYWLLIHTKSGVINRKLVLIP
jgi:hypothetical protein